MSSTPKGWPSNEKNDCGTGVTSNFTTTPPIDPYRTGLDINFNFVLPIGGIQNAAANTGYNVNDSGKNLVVCVAHGAKAGDLVQFQTGVLAGPEIPIIWADANTFQLPILQGASAGDTFQILRRRSPRVDASGNVQTSAGPGSNVIEFDLDGVDTEVSQDTAVPANSKPLPVQPLNTAGVRVSPATEPTLLGFSAKSAAGVFTLPYDQITVISKNANGDPLQIISYLSAVQVQQVDITYDVDGDFQDLVVS